MFERDLIDKELDSIRKEIQRYKKEGNENMVFILRHLEVSYQLIYTLYRKK
jgi:hypothetical protein